MPGKNEDIDAEMLTMREVSRRLNVGLGMLRKYCNYGLVPNLKRTLGGHRTFTIAQMDWLMTIDYLWRAGFSMNDLREYMLFYYKDNQESAEECKKMIGTHKRQVWQKIEDLQEVISFLERQEELLGQAGRNS